MKTILASIVALSLATGLGGHANAQTSGPNVPPDLKKKEVAVSKGQDSIGATPSKGKTSGNYSENVISTVQFGSKAWWEIQMLKGGQP